MLRDLEELLLKVLDRDSREFMREAVACYQAGAFRAAIVMAMAAAMDDLRRKLMELAAGGGAAAAIKTAAQQVDQIYQAEQAFEATLIDLCQRDANVFTVAEASKMRLLLKTRHLCAHPSGHRATAEEARDVITSVIDIVLARPALLGMVAVTALLDRLEGQLFFPNTNGVAQTVRAEMGQLQPGLYRALASKLFDKVLDAAKKDSATPLRILTTPRPSIRENGVEFLRGMLNLGGPARDAVWTYLNTLLESSESDKDALRVLSADPSGVGSSAVLTRDRSVALARRRIDLSDSRVLVQLWTTQGLLTAQEREEIDAVARGTLLRQVDTGTQNAVAELGSISLVAALIEKLVDDAGSKLFVVSNSAIEAMQGLRPEMAATVTAEQRVRYILGISTSSHGSTHFGREARQVVDTGLGERADFLDALLTTLVGKPAELRDSQVPWVQLTRLITKSARPDVLAKILELFIGHEGDYYYSIKEALEELVSVPAVSEAAKRLLDTGRTAAKAKLKFEA